MDDTFTLQRKHYVNEVFDSYANVESGMTTFVEEIDRINFIYVNGTEWHQFQVSALNIVTYWGLLNLRIRY